MLVNSRSSTNIERKTKSKCEKIYKEIIPRKWRASVNQAAESKVLEIKAMAVVY